MAHSRDVRTAASEIKFVVPNDLADAIREWARQHLQPDPHGAGFHQDEYSTTTLYFDTGELDVFHRRGSFGRCKYRIRRYSSDEFVFLERKLRQPRVLAKRRTQVSLGTLSRLTNGHLEPWPGAWFHRRLLARRLRPVSQVAYERMARVLVNDGNMVRLTLDTSLVAQPTRTVGFVNGTSAPFLVGRSILELKFRGVLPSLFRRLVEEFALNPEPASKYRLGLAASNPALTVERRPAPRAAGKNAEASYA